MSVNRGAMSLATDAESGTAVTVTLTPPAAGDYDHMQIDYCLRGATSWTAGPTHTGAQGVQGTESVTGLTEGEAYEFIAYAVDAGGVVGQPTRIRKAIPTDGTGSIPEKAVENLTTAVEGITEANGYWDTVTSVQRGGPEPAKGRGFPQCFIEVDDGVLNDFGAAGGKGIVQDRLGVNVWLISMARGGEDYPQKEAFRAYNAILNAVQSDIYRGGAACDTKPTRWSPFAPTDDFPWSGVAVRFELLLEYDRTNPTSPLP